MGLQLDQHARARDQACHVAGVRAHVEIDVRRKAAIPAFESNLAPRKGAVHPHHDEPHALADGVPGGAVVGVDIHVAGRAALDARGIAQARKDLPPQGGGQARFGLQEHAEIDAGMFMQVLADPLPVADDLDAHLLQLARGADAVLQQEGRRMDRAHAHDGVARMKGHALVALARLHAGDAQALEDQLLHMGVADDVEIGPRARLARQIAPRGGDAAALLIIVDDEGEVTLRVDAILVADIRPALIDDGLHDRAGEGRPLFLGPAAHGDGAAPVV